MEDYQEFILEIESLLKQQAENLEGTVLKRLHNNFSVYHKSLQTIFNVLVRKSLLQEDPYKYEHKISEITIPSVSPIAENNKGMEMSIRLSGFESQLEFLIHYYQFSLDFLDMKKIKTLATLTTYIKWEKGASASEHNTAILYELMGKISAETDQVSNGILKNAQQGLIKQTKLILKDLKELSSYYRESYKQEIRQKVLPLVQIDEKSYRADPETASRRIKQRFSQVMERTPFYNDLVTELLAELFAENGEKMRQDLLSRFQPKEKKTEKRKNVTHKSLLTDALKILALGGTYLEQAMTKVRSNMAVIENKKESLGEKLKKWLTGLVNKEGNRKIMDLEIFEEDSSLPKTVRIDYQLFSEKTSKQSRLLQSFGSEMSQTFQKLASAGEEDLYKYLSDKTVDLQKTCSFLLPIETYLKTEAPRDQRGRLASLEKDVENIKSCIKKTNSKRFEYSSRMEEQEQLKRLGIDT